MFLTQVLVTFPEDYPRLGTVSLLLPRRASSQSAQPSAGPCRKIVGSRRRASTARPTISRARASRALPWPTGPSACSPPRPQPVVGQGEAPAAMIVLQIVDPHALPVLHHHAVPRNAIRHLGHELGEMERRVGVVPDAQQQHLPIEIVHPSHRTVRNMRRQRQRRLHDRLGADRWRRRPADDRSARPRAGARTDRPSRRDLRRPASPPDRTALRRRRSTTA